MFIDINCNINRNEQTEVRVRHLSGKTIAIDIGEVTFFCTKEQALLIGDELVRQANALSESTSEEIAADNANVPF